jgi:hypothetical protein
VLGYFFGPRQSKAAPSAGSAEKETSWTVPRFLGITQRTPIAVVVALTGENFGLVMLDFFSFRFCSGDDWRDILCCRCFFRDRCDYGVHRRCGVGGRLVQHRSGSKWASSAAPSCSRSDSYGGGTTALIGSHRAGQIRAARFEIFQRAGEVRARRVRSYRRHYQSAQSA